MKILSTLYLIVSLCLFSLTSKAQDNEQLARSAYLEAENLYNKGKYKDALVTLYDAQKYLGQNNTKIQYLRVKIFSAIDLHKYTKMNILTYMRLAKGHENDEGEKYTEMVKLLERVGPLADQIEAQEKLKAQEKN